MTFPDLERLISGLLQETSLAPAVQGVTVEASDHDDDIVRVIIRLERPETIPTDRLITAIQRIEDEVSAVDDRHPSVRFPQAA